MTFKELIDSVNFDNVAPHIVRMYPDMEGCLGWYKIHFDMLRLMTPKYHEKSNDDVCHITMHDWEDGTGLHLHAYPMEGDEWEHSLTKELLIAPDVKATNEELAACCLWHTSFYGFTDKQVSDRFRCYEDWDDDKDIPGEYLAKKLFQTIRNNGGTVPSIRELSPSALKRMTSVSKEHVKYESACKSKIKRKRLFRRVIMKYYYKRMIYISDFIIKCIPALKSKYNYISVEELCKLFKSESIAFVDIPSYANNMDSAAYILNLIQNYDMLPEANNVVLYMARGYEYDVVEEDGVTHQFIRKEERQLYDAVCEIVGQAENIGTGDLIVDVIPELGRQTLIWIAAYNGKPIEEDDDK